MKKHLIYLFVLFCSSANAQKTLDMPIGLVPPVPWFEGTHQLIYKNRAATCFPIKAPNSKSCFVTALHTFKTTKRNGGDTIRYRNGDTVNIIVYINNAWLRFNGHLYYHTDTLIDIAVIEVPNLNLTGDPDTLNGSPLVIGQDCFFFGYPLNKKMTFKESKTIKSNSLPLVNKGIYSGSQFLNDSISVTYVSAHNTYGYSGGPVIGYNYMDKKWQLLGVVSGYYPQRNADNSRENSGIMGVSEVRYLVQIMQKVR